MGWTIGFCCPFSRVVFVQLPISHGWYMISRVGLFSQTWLLPCRLVLSMRTAPTLMSILHLEGTMIVFKLKTYHHAAPHLRVSWFMCPDHMVATNIYCFITNQVSKTLCTYSSAVCHSYQFFGWTIELSVNEDKQSTRTLTLSLVIHRVRFKKNLQKKYISIQVGREGNSENHQF
jgi:hypothetical protein